MIDPKPTKRYRATKAEWNDIREAFVDDRCWVCGAVWHSLHHILSRGQGGDDVVVNLAPVCGSGTTGCHGRITARDAVARSLLRGALMPSNYAYLRYRIGEGVEGWLERNYPQSSPQEFLALRHDLDVFSTLSTAPTTR